MVARLDAAKGCGGQVGCWAGKLGDASAAVRDRAALEVGRAGGPAEAGALAPGTAPSRYTTVGRACTGCAAPAAAPG